MIFDAKKDKCASFAHLSFSSFCHSERVKKTFTRSRISISEESLERGFPYKLILQFRFQMIGKP